MPRRRTAILISGRGSNMAALIEAARDPDFPAEIALVLSNRANAAGLEHAAAAGIDTAVVASRDYNSREAFDAAVNARLEASGIEIVCLAGFMRVLTAGFVETWRDRLINIHPSLLPLFPGLDTHARALEAGVKVHGCTVHYVRAEVDSGPIIIQAAVPVLSADTEESLAARVLAAEHRIYLLALALVAGGKARIVDGRVAVDDSQAEGAGEVLVSPCLPLRLDQSANER
jgi:phosphoribosylglycinamide formyltransferase-1